MANNFLISLRNFDTEGNPLTMMGSSTTYYDLNPQKKVYTQGDQILDKPLAQIGGKGLFIKELEVAMEAGRQIMLVAQKAAGKDVVLSVDSYLSYVTQTALAGAVKQWSAKGGVSIIMDPSNGEILAMASVPTYDPSSPGDAVVRGFTRNRAVTDILEPGSTMKTFTFAATLDNGKVRPTDMFDCQSGRPLFIGSNVTLRRPQT